MNHYHVVLVRVFVFERFSTQFTAQTRCLVVQRLHMPPAAALRAEVFATAQAAPPPRPFLSRHLHALLICIT